MKRELRQVCRPQAGKRFGETVSRCKTPRLLRFDLPSLTMLTLHAASSRRSTFSSHGMRVRSCVLQWLHEYRTEGCTEKAMDGAALEGHLEVVKWLHHNRSEVGSVPNSRGSLQRVFPRLPVYPFVTRGGKRHRPRDHWIMGSLDH